MGDDLNAKQKPTIEETSKSIRDAYRSEMVALLDIAKKAQEVEGLDKTKLREQEAEIKEQGAKLQEQEAKLKECEKQGGIINEQEAEIKEQGAKLQEQEAKLQGQEAEIKKQKEKYRQVLPALEGAVSQAAQLKTDLQGAYGKLTKKVGECEEQARIIDKQKEKIKECEKHTETEPEPELLDVECPEDVLPGDTITIEHGGQRFEVVVPDGVVEGELFVVPITPGATGGGRKRKKSKRRKTKRRKTKRRKSKRKKSKRRKYR